LVLSIEQEVRGKNFATDLIEPNISLSN